MRVLKNLFPNCRSVILKEWDTVNSTSNLSTWRHLTNQSMNGGLKGMSPAGAAALSPSTCHRLVRRYFSFRIPFFAFFPTTGPGPRLHDFTLVSPTHKKILKTLGYIIYVRDEEYLNRLNMFSKKTPSVFSCIRNCVIITRKRWAKVGGATMRQDNQRIIHVNLIRKNSS